MTGASLARSARPALVARGGGGDLRPGRKPCKALRQAPAQAGAAGFAGDGLEAGLRLGETEISSGDGARGRSRLKALVSAGALG